MLVIYVGNNIFIRSKSRRKSIKGAKEEGRKLKGWSLPKHEHDNLITASLPRHHLITE